MKIVAIGLALALTAAATAAQAQLAPPPGPHGGPRGAGGPRAAPPGDPMADLDGRIAEVRDMLRLSPDQQNLWPPVEEGIRGVVHQREEAREAGRERLSAMREARASGRPLPLRNIPEELRVRADVAAGAADAMRRLAEATGPLYDSLSDMQKRRFAAVVQLLAPGRRPPPPPPGAGRGGPPRPQPGMQPPMGSDPGEDADPDAGGAEPQRPR